MASEDCASSAASTAGFMAVVGVPVGLFQAHAALKDLTLAQKMQRWTNIKLTARIMAAPIATFAVCGAAYKATDCLVRQYLGREDVLSGIAGGIAVGTVLGLRSNSAPTAIKLSALFAGAFMVTDFLTVSVPSLMSDLKPTGPITLGEPPAGRPRDPAH